MTWQLGVALCTTMSTGAMGPTVGARRRTSAASIGVAIDVAVVVAVVGVTIVAVVVAVVVGGARSDVGHHLLLLGHEGGFSSGKRGFTLKDSGIGNISERSSSNRDFIRRGHGIKEALGNKIGNSDGGVGMMGWLLMKNVTSSGKQGS